MGAAVVRWAWVQGPEIDLFCRVLVASVFIVAGVGKLSRPSADLRGLIGAYRLVPRTLVPPLAAMLPWVELVAASALLAGVARPFPSLLATAMLLTFAGAVAVNLLRGRRDISCGCFGSLAPSKSISWGIVVRNVALAGISFGVAASPPERLGAGESAAVVLVAAAVLAMIALAQSIRKMLEPPSRPGPTRELTRRPAKADDPSAPLRSPSLLAIEMGREPVQ